MSSKVNITSAFWGRYRQLVRTEMIPFQWNVLNDTAGITIEKERLNDEGIPSEKSHAMENFRIAAGRTKGTHYGWTFQDSDVYKWLEAVAYSLREKMDPELEAKAHEVIDLIAEAQEPDGYLDTYFSILGLQYRYKSLAGSHELYCMGHFIEAAVAYFEATGNEKVLAVAKKAADNIDENFGPDEGKIHGYDGHEEIEIGLLRLYHSTGEKRYLKLAKYFLMERGKHPNFFKEQAAVYDGPNALSGIEKAPNTYFQNHKPVLEMDTAEGHAVRVVYLCTALADLAATTGDKEVYEACKRLWNNITRKRMYITGGIGSTVNGESFTLDYDLPNDTMYCETCAAVGLIFFARQMLRIEPKAEYAEVMERALYNCALAGMALDGKHFFYVNPLEVNPLKSKLDPTKSHVKPVRPSWLGCACCPPNLARLLTSLDDYVYTVSENTILVNLYMDSDSTIELPNGRVKIKQETRFPWDNEARVIVKNDTDSHIRIGIRLPGWADNTLVGAIGNMEIGDVESGYQYFTVEPSCECSAGLTFEIPIRRNYASPLVSEDVGKVAISKGPFIYCLEGADNGIDLNTISLPETAELKYAYEDNLLGGVGVITAEGRRTKASEEAETEGLYLNVKPKTEPASLKFIPYYAWANRGENEMLVWLRES
ncbi:glycoside hydrolase family 127 protein [Pseudobutyrivibrio xylanivorans]|uniref:Beta-L-arabinofuranosidase n=1 Tax=Pseudobutyrivibrio xylanivorans TaxID=185007 RepID=A0A5P6VSD5_PSEXY|nr:beta-L-arabinofuranosidase domain-containing protein [Pseudobutyrivibrio xylanivorans]QFJ54629.1 beta-L-arabinofuranosidase [Pseudobutyrivibrio xylanivorans]